MNQFKRVASLGKILFCLLSLMVSGCTGLLQELPEQGPAMTLAEEKELGRLALPVAIQRLGGRYADPVLADGLSRFGQALARRGPRPELEYQFVLVDRSLPCLYALPAGNILVTRGLLSQVTDETALAALLQHGIQRTTDPPFSGPATRTMGVAAERILKEGAQQAEITLDRPVDQLVQAVMARDERNVLDLGVVRLSGPARETVPAFTEEEQTALAALREMQAGYRLLETAAKLEASGQGQEAITTYLQAGVLAPEQARILHDIGMAYLRANDLLSARVYLQRAAHLQSEYYRTQMGLGYVLLQNGDFEKAFSHLQHSVRLLPVAENYFLLGQTYQQLGKTEQALRYFRAVVEADATGKIGHAASQRLREMGAPQ